MPSVETNAPTISMDELNREILMLASWTIVGSLDSISYTQVGKRAAEIKGVLETET